MSKGRGLTRNCLEPWRAVQFNGAGTIIPCCSGTIAGDFGNINDEYFESLAAGRATNMFANGAFRELRRGLLTGDLSPACVSCRAVHEEDVAPAELVETVRSHLRNAGIGEVEDLTSAFAYQECGGNITNRCNLSCIYCAHSGHGGHAGLMSAEMDRDRFLGFVEFMWRNGLRIFNFCGIGELTVYPGWDTVCEEIIGRCPGLRLRVISNFAKRLREPELATLAQFDLVQVSCDTLDPEMFGYLRKGGRLSVILDNLERLRLKVAKTAGSKTRLAFNVTLTSAVVDKLEGLFRYAAEAGMLVHVSSLFDMPGSVASSTSCLGKVSTVPAAELPHVREVLLDLPRRQKAQNPLSGVWEYRWILKTVGKKADEVTFNEFVPNDSEKLCRLFYEQHPRNPTARLRKLWRSFDSCLRGVVVLSGGEVSVALPEGSWRLSYRAWYGRARCDGNAEILPGELEEFAVSGQLVISARGCADRFDFLLVELVGCDPIPVSLYSDHKQLLEPVPGSLQVGPLVMREGVFAREEEIASRLAESQEPIAIWCAGLRALEVLSGTRLGRANIQLVIDSDPARGGQSFCGRMIHGPDAIAGFGGKIVVLHSSSSEEVALRIRQMGVTNEILAL